MGQIGTTLGLVMLALFAVAIIGFAINFGIDNNSAVKITDDSEISGLYSDTRGTLSTFREDSEKQSASIVETTIEPGSQITQSVGPYKVTINNLMGGAYNVLKVGYEKIFGTGGGFGIFLTALLAALGFVLFLYLIKTWRGQPD
jgi:hypothetical protein